MTERPPAAKPSLVQMILLGLTVLPWVFLIGVGVRPLVGDSHDEGYVFASSIGTAQDARNIVRRYHAIRAQAGLPDLPWHHLRHFAATALIEAGEDLFVVSRILGHTSVATTASFTATFVRRCSAGPPSARMNCYSVSRRADVGMTCG